MTSIPGYKQLCQMTRRPHGAFTQGEHLERVVRPKKRRSIFGILAMLKSLGLTSLNRRLVWLASCSFVSGLSQAALLVVVSELAVSGAQGGDRLKLHGLSLSLHESVLSVCCCLSSSPSAAWPAAFAGSAMSSSAVEAGRAKVIDSFFNASWGTQSAEPLGHIQQLLTVNCENIGWVTLGISRWEYRLSCLSFALLIAAFFVNPITSSVVLVAGILLSTAMRPFLKWSRRASIRLSNDSQRMAVQVTEYTRLTREFRLFGVERAATDRLAARNHQAAISLRKSRLVGTDQSRGVPIVRSGIRGGWPRCSRRSSGNRPGSHWRGTSCSPCDHSHTDPRIQSTSQQLRSFEGFLDGIEADIERYRARPPESE